MSDESKDKEKPIAATGTGSSEVANKTLVEKTISDNVLGRLKELEQVGAIKLPDNYVASNALKFAWLQLVRSVDKNEKPVLSVCSAASVANALLDMCVQGLNPAKKQCYFIAYGDVLECRRSYQGAISVVKRVSKVVDVNAQIVYEGDDFVYSFDKHGIATIVKHEQKLENINDSKIRAAYAIMTYADGTTKAFVMNKNQIMNAWKMGSAAGNSKAHNNFGDEMCRKTVVNRACKWEINNSDDGAMFNEENDSNDEAPITPVKNRVENGEPIDFEEVTATPVTEEKPVSQEKPLTNIADPNSSDKKVGF